MNVIVDCTLVLVVVDSVLRVAVNVGGQVVDNSTLVHKEKVEHRSGGWRRHRTVLKKEKIKSTCNGGTLVSIFARQDWSWDWRSL